MGYPAADEAVARHAAWAAVGVAAPADLGEPEYEERGVEFHLIDLHGNLVRVGAPANP